jgi:hypothetical protein
MCRVLKAIKLHVNLPMIHHYRKYGLTQKMVIANA